MKLYLYIYRQKIKKSNIIMGLKKDFVYSLRLFNTICQNYKNYIEIINLPMLNIDHLSFARAFSFKLQIKMKSAQAKLYYYYICH